MRESELDRGAIEEVNFVPRLPGKETTSRLPEAVEFLRTLVSDMWLLLSTGTIYINVAKQLHPFRKIIFPDACLLY